MLLAVSLLLFVTAESLIVAPWANQLHDIPAYNNTNASGPGVANSLFSSYPFTVVLIGLILAAAMIGGIYLAKMEAKE